MLRLWSRHLTIWIALFALLGYLSALAFGQASWVKAPEPPDFYRLMLVLKSTFISSLKMLVAPMIFFSLIGGLLSIGSAARLRRVGGITVAYYLCTTCIAIGIGLFVVYFIHPWTGGASTEGLAELTQGLAAKTSSGTSFIDPHADSLMLVLGQLLKRALVNPFDALANLNMLGIVANALLFGLALVMVSSEDNPVAALIEQVNRTINKILEWVILFAPVGLYALTFDFTLRVGGAVFSKLAAFALVVFGATMVHGLVVLPLVAFFLGRIRPWTLLRNIAQPLLVALSTSSSAATLPVSMRTAEQRLGVSNMVASFVFPLGATMNMDGTALFEGIAAVFLAHLFGIELSNIAMASVFFMAMVSSIGAPGMPSGSMAGMQMVLLAAGIPLEAIGILLVIERPLDTFRTAVNVEGDLVGSIVVQRYLTKNGNLVGTETA